MSNNKLVFIGPMNLGKVPTAGDSVKNQLFLDRFLQVFDKVYTIDTADWRKKPLILFKLIGVILLHPKAKVIISANPGSADKLIRIVRQLGFHNDFFYWVVGGSFHTMIREGRFSVMNYSFLKGIFVQGQSMVNSLRDNGLNNAVYVPNSKMINHYGKKELNKDRKTHFVFLSRIEEYKGCTDIINAVDILNQSGYAGKFDLVFYGRMSEDVLYAKLFNGMVSEREDVEYRGLLNLRETKNYDELAKYDVMLFPTYWHGEGFPGIVIDAFISSMPIIASDWNLNKEVIEEGRTGWIIPPHDVDALAERMKYVINNREEVQRMSIFCRKRAAQYDSRIVLSEYNLKKLGVLS